jgi:hypothetical protein
MLLSLTGRKKYITIKIVKVTEKSKSVPAKHNNTTLKNILISLCHQRKILIQSHF